MHKEGESNGKHSGNHRFPDILCICPRNNQLLFHRQIYSGIGKILAEELFVQTYKRLLDIYCKTPTELYVDLVRRYPDFLNYITLREIASFLRVTPETISHIRKNIKGIEFC